MFGFALDISALELKNLEQILNKTVFRSILSG